MVPKIYMLHRVLPIAEPNNYYFQRRTAISWNKFVSLLDMIEQSELVTHPISALGPGTCDSGVFITFDDCYRDITDALDEIIRRKMTATIFPVKNFSCTGFSPIDDMAKRLMQFQELPSELNNSLIEGRLKKLLRRLTPERYRRLRQQWFGIDHDIHQQPPLFMSEAQLTAYSEQGIELGIHGTSHRTFISLPSNQLHQELADAKEWLTNISHANEFPICFPHGAHDERVVTICRKYSKHLLGVDSSSKSPQVLKRLWITEDYKACNV